ncbi:signal peptidase I [Sphingomonas prati]|uniref:Signal peptidase I n=2 Tax=Sphingomonas prati TaxID=1843237 RepID=A0A7W9F1B0_9SPHN|nr:signal peptidase I [Sphingomonas prati]MBB5727579.1 signal peptidase I [Sphingomonas prati]
MIKILRLLSAASYSRGRPPSPRPRLTPTGRTRHPTDMPATPARSRFATLRLVAILFVAGWLVRSFAVGGMGIHDGAMLPQLRPGDALLVAKWPYGWSRYGLIGGAPLFKGRWWSRDPVRGDVVMIRDVRPNGSRNVVMRVIGLPGDRVAMRAGTVTLDGRPLPRIRIGDVLIPIRPGTPCRVVRHEGRECRYRRFTETMPDGTSHAVFDSAPGPSDDFTARTVPPATLFLLGDNRDDSIDSRIDPDAGGLGMVPTDRLLGRATILPWSTDRSARLTSPKSWWTTIQWSRIGLGVD